MRATALDTPVDWVPIAQVERFAPAALRSWLTEPGLLTARIRALCGARMLFRMLGPLRAAALGGDVQSRLGLRVDAGLLREIEFRCDDERIVYAQTVLPASTVHVHPWLNDLGDAPIGESLRRRVGDGVTREPLEFAALPPDSALARAAAPRGTDVLWARRAVYRVRGEPILVQEVFLPALLQVPAVARAAGGTP